MCRSCGNLQPVLLCEGGYDAAQACDVCASFLNILADSGTNFDLRLDHLGLDLLAEQHPPLIENLRHVRTQLARLRIDDLKLFFDTESELIEHERLSPSYPPHPKPAGRLGTPGLVLLLLYYESYEAST